MNGAKCIVYGAAYAPVPAAHEHQVASLPRNHMPKLMMVPLRRALILTAGFSMALAAQSKQELPLKYVGPPTKAAITAQDLMTRLYVFADDSMMGRQVGTEYNNKGTAYLEREVRRMGLKPGGENGTYFQALPLVFRAMDPASTLVVGDRGFGAGTDFIARSSGKPLQFTDAEVIFGGPALDTLNLLDNAKVRGKVVLMRAATFGPGFNQQAFVSSNGYKAYQASLQGATIISIGAEQLLANAVRTAMTPTNATFLRSTEANVTLTITAKVAEALLGVPVANATKGMTGKRFTTNVRFKDTPNPFGRNVIAILEGSDPVLKNEYVAIGAHNDHVGFNARPVDHDSLKAFMMIVRPQGADNAPTQATPEQVARVQALTAAARKLRPARADSIFNGADDDGSGSMAVLEIAEAFAAMKPADRPKRSIIFIWHSGEEAGLWGADHFTEHPTVPREAIVAQLNMDMVGRGGADDVTGSAMDGGLLKGGAGYLQLVGSRRLSTELGDLVEDVNKAKKLKFSFDYAIDANGHPQNIYCRSDHYMYARWGIPVVFMTTGGHADYHQVTDEPQYIDYAHMQQISTLVLETAKRVATLDHRIVVDKAKPDPRGACVQ